jgi:hypothetical protein
MTSKFTNEDKAAFEAAMKGVKRLNYLSKSMKIP